jgi:hypothetical protein
MRPVILLACVLSVGACTYVVDHINHKRSKKEGYVSVFPAVRNAIIAAAVGMVLAFAAQNVGTSDASHIHDSPALAIEHPQYTDDTHRSTHATVCSRGSLSRAAGVDA